jgi:glycosyltransferase involved in cell wall biosynthesis
MKILALTIDFDGVGYFRTLNPHSYIIDDNIIVEIRLIGDPTLNLIDENYMKQFDILTYNKDIPFRDNDIYNKFINIIKKYNISIVFDIDDYWILSPTHVNYKMWKRSNSKEKTEQILKNSDYVITTTPLFADRIKTINPNVGVLENALEPTEYQWNYKNKVKSNKTRFLWGGGISHMPDLKLLKDSFKLFDDDFMAKSQLYLCGFDLRIRTEHGIIKGDPKTNQWSFFENIFTNNGKWIKDYEYKKFLNQYDDTNYGINEKFRYDNFYQRRWTKPILTYGTMYQEADVVIVPLKNNMYFNYYKSQLKVIEAGIYKLPIIASNYGPYTIDIEDGVDGFLIDENKPNLWYEKMKWFVNNPSAIVDMGEKLHEKILNKYSMNVVNNKRIELYKKIIKMKNEKT